MASAVVGGRGLVVGRREMVRKILIGCGVLSAVLYVAANVIVPMMDPGYRWMSQTVSELSAIGAPTRELWVWMMIPYGVLLIGFGWGVWGSGENADCGMRNADFVTGTGADKKVGWSLRVVGGMLMAQGVVGFFWPPMHMRGAEFSLTDALHIGFAMIVVPLMMLGIWFSWRVVGRGYAVVTMVVVFGFGMLTGLDGQNIASNLPTPWVGVWERIGILAWVVWVVVLAIRLWKFEGVGDVNRG